MDVDMDIDSDMAVSRIWQASLWGLPKPKTRIRDYGAKLWGC